MRAPLQTALLALVLTCGGCDRRSDSSPQSQPSPFAVRALAELPPAPKTSLYELSLTLVDQDAKASELGVFRGHPVLVSMFFSSCPYACPTLIAELQRFERSLTPSERSNLRVLLVSIDPEHDTPEKLKALAQERHIDETRWRLLRTSEDEVRQLAAVLGVKYKASVGGGFNHSSVLTALDQQGRIRLRHELNGPVDQQFVDVVTQLARQ